MRKVMLLGAALMAPSAAQSTSLKDFWDSRPADAPHFQSAKSSAALEMCLGMELSEKAGLPLVLHGERETIITSIVPGLAPAPLGGTRIVDHGASREIIVGALKMGGWTDKISAIVQRCI